MPTRLHMLAGPLMAMLFLCPTAARAGMSGYDIVTAANKHTTTPTIHIIVGQGRRCPDRQLAEGWSTLDLSFEDVPTDFETWTRAIDRDGSVVERDGHRILVVNGNDASCEATVPDVSSLDVVVAPGVYDRQAIEAIVAENGLPPYEAFSWGDYSEDIFVAEGPTSLLDLVAKGSYRGRRYALVVSHTTLLAPVSGPPEPFHGKCLGADCPDPIPGGLQEISEEQALEDERSVRLKAIVKAWEDAKEASSHSSP